MPEVKRGWSSANLRVVRDDPRYWTVADASRFLGPPDLTEAQVRQLLRLSGIGPVGKRANGPSRRHVRVYDAQELIAAFERLAEVTGEA